MLYCFRPSDKFFLDLCETTDLAGLLDTFLSYHKEDLKTRFSEYRFKIDMSQIH